MKKNIKIDRPADCCGCGACANSCARGAITMQEDAAGFIFPMVDEEKCVECGRCIESCVFTKPGAGAGEKPAVYAAVIKDKAVLKNSSSGGIFSALAAAVLDKGGAVFGAAWTKDMSLAHICVENKADLAKLRGSKYVQSATGDAFLQVKKLLAAGRYVCYCGTPCQIAGLKAFLGKEEEKLLTIDLVCHGVPSMKMLRDDLKFVAGDQYGALCDIKFRDKSRGWGVKGSLMTGDSKIKYTAGTSPYYFYFLKGEVYRESCYNCRFPTENRQGDITLGDYWGVRLALAAKLDGADPEEGISCVLVNSPKGKQWLKEIAPAIALAPSDLQSVRKRNKQLTSPSVPLPEHETLLNGYLKDGYTAFCRGYKQHTKDHMVRMAKDMIPAKVKRRLNELR
ncbi:MAG: Coenzyme F420 hydrogenase/dehydrogenase, beta subunit C-terminal domain [Clostridia bacterium]|nr:Coenzyme F420 hydrogenase/dehydrogenase, beta subunit C-terminal domain [Clostridia bacterium]